MYDEKRMVREIVYEWQKKAAMTRREDIGTNNVVNVKNIVSELSFIVQRVKILTEMEVESGELKFWVGQTTHGKPIKFNQDHKMAAEFHSINKNKDNKNKSRGNELSMINKFEFNNKDG